MSHTNASVLAAIMLPFAAMAQDTDWMEPGAAGDSSMKDVSASPDSTEGGGEEDLGDRGYYKITTREKLECLSSLRELGRCAIMAKIGHDASEVADNAFPPHSPGSNAVRHCVLAGVTAVVFGEENAWRIMARHEDGHARGIIDYMRSEPRDGYESYVRDDDTVVDLHNNSRGIEWAKELPGHIIFAGRGSPGRLMAWALRVMADKCRAGVDSGDLLLTADGLSDDERRRLVEGIFDAIRPSLE